MGGYRAKQHYSRQQVRQMAERIEQTKQANKHAEMLASLHRSTDAYEIAKLALQRRGYVVFANSVRVPGCEHIAVGNKLMSREEVIAYAERWCPRTSPQE